MKLYHISILPVFNCDGNVLPLPHHLPVFQVNDKDATNSYPTFSCDKRMQLYGASLYCKYETNIRVP